MATPGRKAYPQASGFLAACRRYVKSISYMQKVVQKVPEMQPDEKSGVEIPVTDGWGHIVYREEPIYAENGKPAEVRAWVEAPSVTGCCLFLGISRQAWSEYAKQNGYQDAVQWIRMLVEQYNIQQLSGKGAAGAKFTLEHNFGWKERHEVSLDEKTTKAVTAAGLSPEEKREMIFAMLRESGNDAGG